MIELRPDSKILSISRSSRNVEFVLTRTGTFRSSAYRIMSKISGFRNGSPKFQSAISFAWPLMASTTSR